MTSTDPLVEALATRLRRMDLIGWQRVATWAEQSELSFEDLRLLLALALKIDDGPASVSELAELAGFPLDVAYPATHRLRGRGYLREERRQYSLSQQGRELVAMLDAARRRGHPGIRRPARSRGTAMSPQGLGDNALRKRRWAWPSSGPATDEEWSSRHH